MAEANEKSIDRIEKSRNKLHGYDKNSFPMIRPEKEELFAQTGFNKGGF